jgi:citrate lyase beta subunit
MEKELQLDIANGFIGKTVIHPSQIPFVRKWLQPVSTDVKDARSVLQWKAGAFGVEKSVAGNRMNELATHQKWAKRILILSEIYGEREG